MALTLEDLDRRIAALEQSRALAMEHAIAAIIKDVCAIDWHGSSPGNKPNILAVTVEELTLILRRHLLSEE